MENIESMSEKKTMSEIENIESMSEKNNTISEMEKLSRCLKKIKMQCLKLKIMSRCQKIYIWEKNCFVFVGSAQSYTKPTCQIWSKSDD